MRRSVKLLESIAAGILVFAAAGAAVLEAPKLPDSLDGRRLAAFLAAANTGTEPALKEFVENNFSPRDLERFPAAPRVARFLRFAGEAAPLVLVKVLEPTPSGPAMLVRSSRTQSWFEIRLDLSRDPSREILGIDIEDSDASAAEPEPTIKTRAQAVAAADAYLSGLARNGRFSGVALLAQQGKPFYEKAYGLADRERKIPNTVATRFNIGSINKIFTQVAIAQLAASGKLSLSDTVRKILPDYPSLNPNPNPKPNSPSSSPADEITVLQLINMTSGLGDIFGDGYADAAPHLSTLADYLKLFADKPLLFPPGKGRQYSNAGYVVLGLIIERVSGQGYHDYVRDHIFAPASMASSGPSRRGVAAANLAIGYSREGAGPGSQLAPNTDTLPARSSSAGGGLSTAADLLAFDTALRAGKLLPPDWTAWIYSDKNAPPSPGSAPESRGGLGIAGGSPGVNAALEEAGDFQIIVLANLDPPAAERAAAKFRRWLTSL